MTGREYNHWSIIDSMPDGFAYHKIITDKAGNPVDFIILELNNAFEKQTGWKKEDIAGKKATEVLPGNCGNYIDLINIFGKVALTGKSIKFQQFFGLSNRCFEITAFSHEYGYFSVALHDITERLEVENALQYQLEFEKTVSDVSAFFASIPPERTDEGIDHALQVIGYTCAAERCYLFLFSEDGTMMNNTHEWCAEGIPSQKDFLQGLSSKLVPWWMKKLERFENIVIENVALMPPEAEKEKEILEIQANKSVVIVPVVYLNKLTGFIGLDYVTKQRMNFKNQVVLLEIMSQVVSNAIQRQLVHKVLYESEAKYRLLFENAPLGILGFDQAGIINACNDFLIKIACSFRERLIGENLLDPSNRKLAAAIRDTLQGIPVVYEEEYRQTSNQAAVKAIRTWFAPLTSADGRIAGGMGIVEDISERLRFERAREEANRRLTEIIELLPDATFVIDNKGQVIYWNKAIEEMTGVPKDDMIGKDNYEYALPFYGDRRPIVIDRALLNEVNFSDLEKEYDFVRLEGDTLLCEAYAPKAFCGKGAYLWGSASSLRDMTGKIIGAIETIRDITDRKREEKRLEFISLYDQLTGLHNRTFFEKEMHRIKGSKEYPITIISADLNGLKIINDTMGHCRGDKLLEACAQVLRESLRGTDILARLGGDEFAAILPGTNEKAGEDVANRLRSNVAKYNLEHPELPLSLSIGLATAKGEGVSLEETLKISDNFMYREKLFHNVSSRNQIIKAMLAALAERDYLAEGHAQRLSELCFAMGVELGLSPKHLNNLTLLAKVHDLGKVGIPDRVLHKKGPLTEGEWEIMRQHPEKGYRIALSSTDLPDMAELILKHHERWDGKGYPLGLKGKEIPIECRVLAIVDAFDAMTNERPYSKAISRQKAIGEIIKGAGTQFDPELVEVFLSVIK
jgi:diguanylate cyclase (GGDEF)-like protein/PAS domain S-box-containing protein